VSGTGAKAPRLLIKTLAVTFITVSALLAVVFALVTMRARSQVRESVSANLESTQRLFAALERRWQTALRAQTANLAENPTLKAALDIYSTEFGRAATSTGSFGVTDDSARIQLLATIAGELEKISVRTGSASDAVVLVDRSQETVAAAGRLAEHWPVGEPVRLSTSVPDENVFDDVVEAGGGFFRVLSVPLRLDDHQTGIGTLYLTIAIDETYANSLKQLSTADIVIVKAGRVLAATLPARAALDVGRQLASARGTIAGVESLADSSFAFRRLLQLGDTTFYALASIDESSQALLQAVGRDLAMMAIGASALALLGSFWLAHLVTGPIGRLSGSIEELAAQPHAGGALPLTGSSREIDTLAETFNALMASLRAAEAQAEAAYAGAIQALAMALDARDPYTAGHSERVSKLSVAMGRALGLSPDELDVLRLGALLHDIGKIGVPDAVLRKPTALTDGEMDVIKQHPVHGARILQSVPFLARHISIVELHHERWDGRGYPHGLHGEATPLLARLVHVADAYDAMTSARAYRRAMPHWRAMAELRRCAGSDFDAQAVRGLEAALAEPANHALASPELEAVHG
jgi:putative nucleotidyltransferase with HDIG domain